MVVTDRRLEAQRAVIAVRLAGVVREMSAVGTASARGNRRDFVRARAALNGAIVALRGTVNQTP